MSANPLAATTPNTTASYPYIGYYTPVGDQRDKYIDNLYTAVTGSPVTITAGAIKEGKFEPEETKTLYLAIDNSARCKKDTIPGIRTIARVDLNVTGGNNSAAYTFSSGAPHIRNAGVGANA
jgi:hypothetical protein